MRDENISLQEIGVGGVVAVIDLDFTKRMDPSSTKLGSRVTFEEEAFPLDVY